MGLQHIIAATDFSNRATRAVSRAAMLASEHQATLELLHATPTLPTGDTEQTLEGTREDLQRQLLGVWDTPGYGSMDGNVKVVVLGTGQMGSGIIKLLLQKHGVELVGVYGRRAHRVGTDVGTALGFDTAIGVKITNDLPALLGHTKPHVVIQATCSRILEAVEEITPALHHGANVISIAEEMAYPAYQAPHLAAAIHQLAMENQVTVVGSSALNRGEVPL